ncbi:GNAT family N-acetyltransferase [Clostridium senegalense]|uniref:GNAT family N-acetyltransferase n=1 Tax=Clostridium senegalense TaxID=1465809 RepID=UPI00028A3EA8|nr:GNAT family N-acetyltransferase [Clostridium senegalense]
MSVKIKDVTQKNWREVEKLRVGENQREFIEPNSYSLAQSCFEPEWKSVALYCDNLLVGYAMYGMEKTIGNVWIDRFMIDKDFQGKGYGSQCIKALINHVKNIYNCNEIRLSTHLNNKFAQKFYEKIGFKINGEIDSNEQVMIIKNI